MATPHSLQYFCAQVFPTYPCPINPDAGEVAIFPLCGPLARKGDHQLSLSSENTVRSGPPALTHEEQAEFGILGGAASWRSSLKVM